MNSGIERRISCAGRAAVAALAMLGLLPFVAQAAPANAATAAWRATSKLLKRKDWPFWHESCVVVARF